VPKSASILYFVIMVVILTVVSLTACSDQSTTSQQPAQPPTQPPMAQRPQITREQSLPATAVKMTPDMDLLPPQLQSDKYENPVPLGLNVNTAGAEDSAFVTPDGNTLYLFFTPDPNIPPEKQLLDGVTGIYVAKKQNGDWAQAQRVWLQDAGELSLDGCEFVQGNIMWFCTARQGNYKAMDMWTAEFKDGKWMDWQNAGQKLNLDYEIGEMHITADGSELYFHSGRPGGKGGYDIWVIKKANGEWQPPENVEAVNTSDAEGWPFVSQDGNELWFTRFYMGSPAIFRSQKDGGQWRQPELIVSQFAGEPTLDNQGNLYFTHHFYKDNKMIEADIYVAKPK
jgi:WD40-like Beta Propeller Repeat